MFEIQVPVSIIAMLVAAKTSIPPTMKNGTEISAYVGTYGVRVSVKTSTVEITLASTVAASQVNAARVIAQKKRLREMGRLW